MGRAREPYGYTMGQCLDNALMEIEDAHIDIETTLKTHPLDPVVWVQCIGRILAHIRTAANMLRIAKKIFDENKTRGGNGDADESVST